MPPKRRKGKQASREVALEAPGQKAATDTMITATATADSFFLEQPKGPPVVATAPSSPKEVPLVLTSDKRRGVYECDYCHADISQVPRIRCAICVDFDLCLDCFASADHATTIAGLKAVHDVVTNSEDNVGASTAPNHNDTHGYIVADSTRYVLFPPSRAVVPYSRPPSSVDEGEGQQQDVRVEEETAMEASESKAPSEECASEKDVAGDIIMADASQVTDDQTNPPKEDVFDKETQKAKDTNPEKQNGQEEEQSEKGSESVLVVQEDPKCKWTVEEDLRLLDAIATCGLGNWVDIAEAISGQGSSNKSPKRCMERYLDDFLGRYGQILPQYTVVDCDDEDEQRADEEQGENEAGNDEDDVSRASKRRRLERSFSRSYSAVSIMSTSGRKKKKIVPTSSLPGYDKLWPSAYVPPIPTAEFGQEVGRVAHARAEQAFVKEVSQAGSTEEANKIRAEWTANRLNKVDGPTVLPMRAEDIQSLKGSELAGYMPRRGDFDMEWDNEAETVLADMEFTSSDLPQDRQLKIQIIEMYNAKLDERERRKKFLLRRNLLDYRKNQRADEELPRDERELVRRMRLFERLHTPEEHQKFIEDILKAKRLRKEIAKLQMYRRIGITSLAEAEKFELDKSRREFHKHAYLQKEAEAAAKMEAANSSIVAGDGATFAGVTESSSYWKQYRTTGRVRRGNNNRMHQDASDGAVESVLVGNGTAAQRKTGTDSSKAADKPGSLVKQDKCGANEDSKQAEDVTESIASEQRAAPAQGNCGSNEKPNESALVGSPGFELLSSNEVELCENIGLLPAQYLNVKSALIQESMKHGLLDKSLSKRTIVKIDVEKHGEVVDFMVRAGWIASKRVDSTTGGKQQQSSGPPTVRNG